MEIELNQTAIAVIISFFGYMLYGAAGFGAAMIFHSLWTLLEIFNVTNGSVKEATYYLNIMTLMVTLVMSVNNRKYIQWSFVFAIVIPWSGMNVVGCYLLTSVPNKQLKFALGIVLLGIFLQQTYRTTRALLSGSMLQERLQEAKEKNINGGEDEDNEDEIPLVDLKKQWPWVLFVGLFGGILSGLFNMPGPSTIIVLLFSGIHRERWKANFFTWQIPAQIFVVWYLSFPGGLFKKGEWYWYIIMCCSSMLSSKIGNYLGQYLDKTTFAFIVISLAFLGALSDISVYFPNQKNIIVMVGFGVAFVMMAILFCLLYHKVTKPFTAISKNLQYQTLNESPNSRKEGEKRIISSISTFDYIIDVCDCN